MYYICRNYSVCVCISYVFDSIHTANTCYLYSILVRVTELGGDEIQFCVCWTLKTYPTKNKKIPQTVVVDGFYSHMCLVTSVVWDIKLLRA